MNLDLTPQEVRILYISLQDYMDDSGNSEEDLEIAGRISFLLKESLTKKPKKIRSGKLKCGVCTSDVKISTGIYGGMQRWVCTDPTCTNSEIALDLENTNDM